MRKCTALLLIAALLLSGCSGASADLMEGYIPRNVSLDPVEPAADPMGFAVNLFQSSAAEGENTLVSPLSVLSALTMSINGADGKTLTQMEHVLGATRGQLNSWLFNYMKSLDEDQTLHLANAIWFNAHERFTPNRNFLQTNADYFGAGIHEATFDAAACRAINSWVKEHTNGMIDGILDEIPEDAVMYLVNALAFEAKWASVYEKSQVRPAAFTTEDGRKQDAELMYDTVNSYLETLYATGFIRYYEGNRYAFAALLPRDGVTVAQLVEDLSSTQLSELLAAPQNVAVETAIPKFEAETTLDLNQILMDMGMTNAFDPMKADFSSLGSSAAGNIHISRVIHKTFISVAEQGTRAGAATVIENSDRAMGITEDSKRVILDRPFVYMLIDCQNNLPIFMGTCMEISS